MASDSTREALFISHASPEDNAFTLWLGAKLTALGYEVFADILRLRGGNDWERTLEDAIRNRAAKFLLVATPISVQKQGVRNEITIATQTAKSLDDSNFIVPLRVGPFDAPLQIAHAQYIDFVGSWAQGLSELLMLLDEVGVPRDARKANSRLWQGLQLIDARAVTETPEELVSNWLAIEALPKELLFYDFKPGISLGKAQSTIRESGVPVTAFNRGFLSFAPLHQLQDLFGPDLPLECVAAQDTEALLEKGWPELGIASRDARAKFSDLTRRSLDNFFEANGLRSFEFSSGQLAWWPSQKRAGLKKIPFVWPGGPSGSRQIVGRSNKRGFYWHYAVSCRARVHPVRHVRVIGRVVFTSDGHSLFSSPKRLHRMRRSYCKSWRNDKWRDLLLTFWFWLSNGTSSMEVPMGEQVFLRLRLPPMAFDAPFSVCTIDTESADEDDGASNSDKELNDEDADDEFDDSELDDLDED